MPLFADMDSRMMHYHPSIWRCVCMMGLMP
jgi:hypothetical protein